MKNILTLFILFFGVISYIEAGCGSCAMDGAKNKSSFIEVVPSDGKVKGKTFASCGMCNFDSDDRKCSLSVKIGKEVYSVANVGIDDQLDSHAKDGFCNVVRVVDINGKIKNNKLYATTFNIK